MLLKIIKKHIDPISFYIIFSVFYYGIIFLFGWQGSHFRNQPQVPLLLSISRDIIWIGILVMTFGLNFFLGMTKKSKDNNKQCVYSHFSNTFLLVYLILVIISLSHLGHKDKVDILRYEIRDTFMYISVLLVLPFYKNEFSKYETLICFLGVIVSLFGLSSKIFFHFFLYDDGRVISTLRDPNTLGFFLDVAIFILFVNYLNRGFKLKMNVIYYLGIILCYVCLLYVESLTSFLMLGTGIIITILCVRNFKKGFILVIGLIVITLFLSTAGMISHLCWRISSRIGQPSDIERQQLIQERIMAKHDWEFLKEAAQTNDSEKIVIAYVLLQDEFSTQRIDNRLFGNYGAVTPLTPIHHIIVKKFTNLKKTGKLEKTEEKRSHLLQGYTSKRTTVIEEQLKTYNGTVHLPVLLSVFNENSISISSRIQQVKDIFLFLKDAAISSILWGDYSFKNYQFYDSYYLSLIRNNGIISTILVLLFFIVILGIGYKKYRYHAKINSSEANILLVSFVVVSTTAFIGSVFNPYLLKFPSNFLVYLFVGIIVTARCGKEFKTLGA